MAVYGVHTLLRPATESQLKRVRERLDIDSDRFEQSITLLEEWMDQHPFIPKNYEKNMLRVYLRFTKGNIERAKEKIQVHFVYKKKCPEFFKFYVFNEQEKKTLQNMYFFPATSLTADGDAAIFTGCRTTNLEYFDTEVIHKVMWMLSHLDNVMSSPRAGCIFVFNANVMSTGMAAKMLNPYLKKSATWQKFYPARVTKVLVVNTPKFFESTISIVKMFFKEKIRSRVIVDSNQECLKEHLPDFLIPKDMGGTALETSEQFENWMKILGGLKEWYSEQENMVIGDIPESLAISEDFDDLNGFGVDGTFRQLNVD